jgi:hypothetical protein
MIMKPLQPLLAALLLASATAQGGIIIPDANPTGISSTLNISGLGSSITDVNVTINVTGGFNGDLYAYLSYNGILVPLLQRVGTGLGSPIQSVFGFSTAGFSNVTLDSQATGGSIHDIASPGSLPTYSYTPDGGSLAAFNGSDPNGTWTIFFADMASGGGSGPSTLQGWTLDITAVPEPVNVAMGVFGVCLAGIGLGRRIYARAKAQSRRFGREVAEVALKPAKAQSGMVDIVVVVAAMCLGVIVLGLIFAASRPFAMKFGFCVFVALVAAGIGVLARVGWIVARHALRRQ